MKRRSATCAIYMAFFLATFISNAKAELKWIDRDYQFTYPGTSVVIQSPYDPDCKFIVPKKNSEKHPTDLQICKYRTGFFLAVEKTGFFLEDGIWQKAGSMDAQRAIGIHLPDGIFMVETRDPPTCGITEPGTGYHAAGGQCYSSLQGNNKISVGLTSDGTNLNFAMMRKITRSIKIKRREAADKAHHQIIQQTK